MLDQLAVLNPSVASLVDGPVSGFQQDGAGRVEVKQAEAEAYTLSTTTAGPSLLRAAIPIYPGWSATVDGRAVDLRAVDHALIGIPVPAGRHAVELRYRSWTLRVGALLSLATLALMMVAMRRYSSSSMTT